MQRAKSLGRKPPQSQRARFWSELQPLVDSGKMSPQNASYLQEKIIKAGLMSRENLAKIIKSGVRPNWINSIIGKVQNNQFNVWDVKRVLLQEATKKSKAREMTKPEIDRLVDLPRGQFYKSLLGWEGRNGRLPINFRNDLIGIRLNNQGLRYQLKKWDGLEKKRLEFSKRRAEAKTNSEKRDLRIQMEQIQKKIDRVLCQW